VKFLTRNEQDALKVIGAVLLFMGICAAVAYCSVASAEVVLVPKAPCVLVASALSSTEIGLVWKRGMSGVDGVVYLDRDVLSWSSQTQALNYDVVEGSVGDFTSSSCFVTGISVTSISTPVPAAGTGRWYLVRARNECGAGTWGTTSTAERVVSVACGAP